MLEDERGLSETGLRSLQTAQRQTERMKELIEGLLLLSQVESHRLEPGEGDRISITELMLNVIAALEKYAAREQLRLSHPEGMFLLGIGIEIEGICINLVENAIKYANPGAPIDVSWEESPNGEFVFSVRDQGPGIEKQELPNITKRYYRGSRSRADTSGSGLGLAIVQHAANKHGASFDIESSVGEGSCFSVSFPTYRCLHDTREVAAVVTHADY
jgi:two-component system phosphate regulon sensor histidine kinase PhoR